MRQKRRFAGKQRRLPRQAGSFQGFLTFSIQPKPCDFLIGHGDEPSRAKIDLDPAGPPYTNGADKDHHEASGLEEVLDLQLKAIPDLGDITAKLHEAVDPGVDIRVQDAPGRIELSVRREELQDRLVIQSVPGFECASHELEVLLRHRSEYLALSAAFYAKRLFAIAPRWGRPLGVLRVGALDSP